VGDSVGASVGDSVGDSVGASVGDSVGASVGDSVGDSVGASVGDSVGASVGDGVLRVNPPWPSGAIPEKLPSVLEATTIAFKSIWQERVSSSHMVNSLQMCAGIPSKEGSQASSSAK